MRSVLLAGPSSSDPAGKRAVHQAVQALLPRREVVEVNAGAPGRFVLGQARAADGIVVAGVPIHGPYRHPGSRPAGETGPLRSLATIAGLAAAARRPFAAVGVTAGPIAGPATRQVVNRIARRLDLLLIGDEESARHLVTAGTPVPLRVAADPAWAVLADPTPPSTQGDAVVVVVDGRVGQGVEADLAVGLEAVARAGHRIRLMPWAAPGCGDGAMSWRLTQRLRSVSPVPVEVESEPRELPEAAERFSTARVVVALRYRAIHAAAAAGVPFVGVAVDSRIPPLAAALGQPVVQPGDLASCLPLLIDRSAPSTAPAPAAVRAEIARSRAGLDLLRLLLDPSDVDAVELNSLPLVPVPWLS